MSGSKKAWKPFVRFEYQNLLPTNLRNKLRKLLVFTEATGTKQVNQSPAVSQGYRYPSPDKQAEGVFVPSSDSKDSIYNISYYTRDIRRFPQPLEVGIHPSIPVEKRAEIPADAKRGSPGNKNPAVLSYDSTGTRSAMSTTHEARDKLIMQHVSTHNVRFEWEGDAEKDIVDDNEAKNLPPTPGRPFVWDFPSQSRIMRCYDDLMQFTVMPEFPILPAPEVVAKTDQSITLRVQKPPQVDGDVPYKLQASYSEHGYVYYSWNNSVLFTGHNFPVKGLTHNTTYVFRVRVVHEAARQCGEWSLLTPNVRTFTEEEDAKRSGTVFEHALKLEREQKSILQHQISKLTGMLDERKTSRGNDNHKVQLHEDMLASRRVIDTRLGKLQRELSAQTMALQTIKSQRAADEQMISELLNEQETLRSAQSDQQGQVQYELEMQTLRAQLEKNEEALKKHQEQVNASHEQISSYEASLEAKKSEISQKEKEVERIMIDCNRMVQEQADLAHVKQLEVEDALLEAKTSLEQQLDINTYLREEVSRLREENHHLKNQIEEVDSEVVPKLVRLEDENEQLRAQLSRR